MRNGIKVHNQPDVEGNRVTTIIHWLWRATRGNRLQASLNAVIGILQVAASLVQVWAVKHAIDVAAAGTEHTADLYLAVGFMAAIILTEFAFSIAAVWVRNILGVKAQNRMQQRMLDRILRSEWRGRESMHSGDIMNRLESDVNNVVGFITETLPSTLSTLTLFAGAFFYLYSMDETLALITIAVIPACILLSKFYVRKMRRLNRDVRNQDSRIQSVLQETIQNRMLIKTLEGDSMMLGRLEQTQQTLRRRIVKRTLFSLTSRLTMSIGFSASYLIAFLWSALRMSAGTLSFGGMTAFLQLVNRIQSPARNLTHLVPAFVSVMTAAERLMELENTPEENLSEQQRMHGTCGIRLEDVSYIYHDGEEKVIDHLSFDFKPGTATAVTGETGGGKTTLMRMVLALLKPTDGNLYIYSDSDEAVPVTPAHRCNMVYVPQGNTLMSGTIRDNLLLGKPDATDAEMEKALRDSCANFVFDLPDGLDTVCSESGGGLSEGQAQRITIARALLRDTPILLLDEATSALDEATQRRVLRNIVAQHPNKIVILTTHRTGILDLCKRTYRVEQGTITEVSNN